MTTLQWTPSRGERTAQRTGLGVYLLGIVVFAVSASRSEIDTGVFAVVIAVGLTTRGLTLHRPLTPTHVATAIVCLLLAHVGYTEGHTQIGFVLVALSGWVLVLPTASVPQPEEHDRIDALVHRTAGDPLTPFALNSAKSYFFNAAGTAAIAYRARAGIAVVSGDPIGDAQSFDDLLTRFTAFASGRGWRVAVLAASEHAARLWQTKRDGCSSLRSVEIGRDVVVDVRRFSLDGRRFRNLRQAVQRSRNAGVSTEILRERDVPAALHRQLLTIVAETRGGRQRRGFSMILDHLLDGVHPGMMIVVARDRQGRPVGFQRYGTARNGDEWSLDVPWRSSRAPGGTDERMIVDVVEHVRIRGGPSVSLAFAPFPSLFSRDETKLQQRVLRAALRLGGGVIALESLYRYLDKFHAESGPRFVLFGLHYLVPAAFAMLTFEFVPHREHGTHRNSHRNGHAPRGSLPADSRKSES